MATQEIGLSHNRPERIAGTPTLECVEGRVWLTRAGMAGDVFLHPGERYAFDWPASVLVEALGAARIVLHAPPTPFRAAPRDFCYLRCMTACELCESSGGAILWQDERCRVVRVAGADGAAFPGFCRVIWHGHVREMADLAPADRRHLLDVVDAVERAVRAVVHPDKINLASLGNVVPHLHWHVIPRWSDDSHFPAPIWAAAARPVPARPLPASADLAAAIRAALKGSP